MTGATAETAAVPTTFAAQIWPDRSSGGARLGRALLLTLIGSCLLAISAKVQVPGPVPTTLQTLVVVALGALLGPRIAVAAVLAYVVEGLFGLPVFANTPPLAAGPAYLLGPTGGYLVGFAAASLIVGLAAERGLVRRVLPFAFVLTLAMTVLLAFGWLWLALVVPVAGGSGLGFARAFELGVRPFLAVEAVKVALAALLLPPALSAITRRSR